MKWLLKILSALARPLGISSPDDLRARAASKDDKTFALAPGRTSDPQPPKNPTSPQ